MKILIVHNGYQQRGGEDSVVDAELALLCSHGHQVRLYHRSNDELHAMSRLAAARDALWNPDSRRDIDHLCEEFAPDLIHVHNTFPLISPAFFSVARKRAIPLVQTLHNFRLLCPQAMMLREQAVCDDCVGHLPWRAVTRRCYRDSACQSAVVAGMLGLHRALGTYSDLVSQYIVPSEFCRARFIAGGLPAARLRVKPHFVAAPPAADQPGAVRSGALFVGRLSEEKGLALLCSAVDERPASVSIIGDGPLASMAHAHFGRHYLGRKSQAEVMTALQKSDCLVAPSICHESFGMNLIEAFACGTPVIASGHGAYAELVRDGVTGLLFTPGDARDLARKLEWAEAHPMQMRSMGAAARNEYHALFTPQRNYHLMMEIYEHAISAQHREQPLTQAW